MRTRISLLCFAAVIMLPTLSAARRKPKSGGDKHPHATTQAQAPSDDGHAAAAPAAAAKTPKTKVYSFTGMDVEGKLKTPQLLYFLNRIQTEFQPSTPEKRSFRNELENSASDKAL
jgi:hypothetical protein